MQGDKRTLETTPTEAEIRAWLASRYPPDFPPMRNWGGAIRMLVAEVDRLREMIAEAYQVVGALGHYTQTFDHPDVIRALDNFATGGEGPVPHPRFAAVAKDRD